MLRISLLLFLLATCRLAPAQAPPDFFIRYFNTENGLPSNGIKGLEWDEETGFLWIATEAGISRFNGLDFKNFTHDNTPFIASERMLFMARNNSNRIYGADITGNIVTVKENKLLYFGKETRAEDNSKMFTITISDKFFLDATRFKDKHPISMAYDWILSINDTSCFIVHSQRIYKYSAGMEKVIDYADTSLFAGSGFKIGDKCFIVDQNFRVQELKEDPSANKIFPVLMKDGSPFPMRNPNNRTFWTNKMQHPIVINGNNAWELQLSGNKLIASLICNQIPPNALIDHIQYSRQNKTIFIGTASKGMIVMNSKRLTPMKKRQIATNERNSYYSQLELPDGNILTGEGHIIGEHTINPSSHPLSGKFGNYVSTTGDSLLWYSQPHPVTGYYYLKSYNYRSKQTTHYEKLVGEEILLRPLSDGRQLLTTREGIGWLVGDSVDYIYRHTRINFITPILDFIEIQPGIILIASCAGILQFDLTTRKLDTLMNSEGFCVRSLWKYKDYIFFGTYGKGIFVWKNGQLKPLPLDKKKYLLYAHCFIPDTHGYCWISTNRGLFKADVSELVNAFEKEEPVVYYHYYGKSDGMEMLEMNGGCTPCALTLKNNTISFPTMDGLLWVDPAKALPILPSGRIFIDRIVADTTDINPDHSDNIELPANTNDLVFHLAFSSWCNKENIYVDYQLNDTLQWKPVNTDNDAIVRISNLSPGDYTIRFRKLNGFGANSYTYKTIHFTIVTPWYRKAWFFVVAFLAVTGLIYLLVRLRTRQLEKNQLRLEKLVSQKTRELQETNAVLEKNNTIKTRLISIISHDIITPLKFLTVAGKNLLQKKELMPESLQHETITEMTNTSQELQLLSTNILNWIKYQTENRRLVKENFNLHELVSQVTGVLGSFANQKHIRLINETDKQLTLYQFLEPLKIIIYNLVSNAINFTDQGKVIISNTSDEEKIIVTVKDDGVGMTAEQIQNIMTDQFIVSSANIDNRKGNGLGYLIIKDLVKMTGVSLSIESKKGVGTSVNVVIPVELKG